MRVELLVKNSTLTHQMKNIINTILTISIIYLAVDAFVFVMWAVSGQHPVDGFYVGAVTTTIIKSLIALF